MSNAAIATTERETVVIPQRDDCYKRHVDVFISWMNEHGYTSPLEAVQDYFKYLHTAGYKAGTIRMKRQAVKNRLRLMALSIDDDAMARRFERYLSQLDADPETKAPTNNTSAVSVRKTINEREYRKLLDNVRSARQRCFIRFMYATGARVGELVGIRLTDAEQDGEGVNVRVIGKGRKERYLRLPVELFTAIRQTFEGTEYLFETQNGRPYRTQYVSDQIAKLTLHVLGRRLSAHKLRHSFGTRMVEKHPDKIGAVSQFMGHSQISTTLQFYVHTELTDAELFGAVV